MSPFRRIASSVVLLAMIVVLAACGSGVRHGCTRHG
jgi:hypothetical protein